MKMQILLTLGLSSGNYLPDDQRPNGWTGSEHLNLNYW